MHNTFSQRRFFLATLTPGLIAQWLLRRSYTVFYKRPFPKQRKAVGGVVKGMQVVHPLPISHPFHARSSLWVRMPHNHPHHLPATLCMQRVAKLRMLLDTAVESSDIGTVYLVRLYVSAFSVISVLIVLIVGAPFSFVLPYMFQVVICPSLLSPLSSLTSPFSSLTSSLLSSHLIMRPRLWVPMPLPSTSSPPTSHAPGKVHQPHGVGDALPDDDRQGHLCAAAASDGAGRKSVACGAIRGP